MTHIENHKKEVLGVSVFSILFSIIGGVAAIFFVMSAIGMISEFTYIIDLRIGEKEKFEILIFTIFLFVIPLVLNILCGLLTIINKKEKWARFLAGMSNLITLILIVLSTAIVYFICVMFFIIYIKDNFDNKAMSFKIYDDFFIRSFLFFASYIIVFFANLLFSSKLKKERVLY